MKFKFLLLTFLLSFQSLIAQNTVVDIIVNSPDHNVLETAIIEAGLAGTLSGPGPFTVFAPTDAAFSAIPDSVINALLADPTGTLTDILTYHVIGDSLTTDGLEEAILTTLNGATSILSNLDNDIYIDNAEVTIRDIAASNGVVHVIDVVLDPTRETIADVVIDSPDHNTLEALLTSVSGLGALSASESYTLFAPTDLAFENLGQATIDAVLADEELLLSILSRHVVEGVVLSSMLSDGMQVETADGEIVIVEINSDNEIFINGAQVTVANIERDNGVVHVVDAVIMSTPNTVADIIANSAVHNILEIAIDSAGLTDALSNVDAELTVFAPTDDAFNALPAGTIETLLADPSGLLTTILTNHVIGATVPAALVSNGLQAEALGGEMLNFTVTENGEVFVENAQVIITDLDADNGVVHVINVVLDPNRTTVYDLVAGSMDHNVLELAIDTANLNGALSLDGPYTVFAPTDDAFNALPDGTIAALLDDPSGILTTVLLNHVVGGNIPASMVANGVQVESVAGETLNFTITDAGEVFLENVQVTVTDLDADNGVVHVINGVLDPNRSTVYDVIAGSMDHNVLEIAIDTATLNGVLSLDGPYTVFAPTDDAFNALPDGTIAALLDDPSGILTTILLNHVIGDNIPASMVANGVQLETVSGEKLNFTVTDAGEVFIENVQVIVTDLDADNGVVHVIDGVLDPTRLTINEVVENSDVHQTLETAIKLAKLNGTLSTDGPFTVFAPTDDAFANFDQATLAALIADPEGDLSKVLLYHVVSGKVLSGDLSSGSVTTVLGQTIDVVVDGASVTVNGNSVIQADIETDNGVVHVLDGVLVPNLVSLNELPYDVVSVFPSPAIDYIQVEMTEEIDNARINIINQQGQIVRQAAFTRNERINVGDLNKGFYILAITSGSGNFISKFTKL